MMKRVIDTGNTKLSARLGVEIKVIAAIGAVGYILSLYEYAKYGTASWGGAKVSGVDALLFLIMTFPILLYPSFAILKSFLKSKNQTRRSTQKK